MYAITPKGVGNEVGARSIREGWQLTEVETFTADWQPGMVLAEDEVSLRWPTDAEIAADELATIRASKAEEIKQHGLSLIQSQIPAMDSYEMVAFLKTLWPTLTDPALQPDLAYARDVYLYAVDRITDLETATREQIEGYVPEDDPNWP